MKVKFKHIACLTLVCHCLPFWLRRPYQRRVCVLSCMCIHLCLCVGLSKADFAGFLIDYKSRMLNQLSIVDRFTDEIQMECQMIRRHPSQWYVNKKNVIFSPVKSHNKHFSNRLKFSLFPEGCYNFTEWVAFQSIALSCISSTLFTTIHRGSIWNCKYYRHDVNSDPFTYVYNFLWR